ncbi:MAG TPA: hypothetical protein DCL21_06330, partial [Alphaproteobacteria bacterium]|nr:hypothetical protein [Alphaproteobacteria bacterium]
YDKASPVSDKINNNSSLNKKSLREINEIIDRLNYASSELEKFHDHDLIEFLIYNHGTIDLSKNIFSSMNKNFPKAKELMLFTNNSYPRGFLSSYSNSNVIKIRYWLYNTLKI